MRKILLFIGVLLFLSNCSKDNRNNNYVDILIHSLNCEFGDRNGEDYVRLWINDTLLFSDTFHMDSSNFYRMKAVSIPKTKDSVKIRVRLISLDTILFAGKHAVDTTFHYRIDDIPYLAIDYFREFNHFRLLDPVRNRIYFSYD